MREDRERRLSAQADQGQSDKAGAGPPASATASTKGVRRIRHVTGIVIVSVLLVGLVILNAGLARVCLQSKRELRECRGRTTTLGIVLEAERSAAQAEQGPLGRSVEFLEGMDLREHRSGARLRMRRSNKPYSVVLVVPIIGCTSCIAEEVVLLSEISSAGHPSIDVFSLVSETQSPYFLKLMRAADHSYRSFVVAEGHGEVLFSSLGIQQSPTIVVVDNSTARIVAAFCVRSELPYRLDSFRGFLLRLGDAQYSDG
ncbi:hypothetical protein JXA88_17995 [Candidatus Fermentibacteria bacterium]|nr:hypothetical protein [Candidatus Fermentibacteria bacterium]